MKTNIDPTVEALKLKIAFCEGGMWYDIINNDVIVCR